MKLGWEVFKGLLFMLTCICLLTMTCFVAVVELALSTLQFPFKWVRKKLAAVLLKMARGKKR